MTGFSSPGKLASLRPMPPRKTDPVREPPHARDLPYAHDVATTEAAQAAFFREQADRHRRDAERERLFAETAAGRVSQEHAARAHQLENWSVQAESVAAALEGKRLGRH